MIDNKLIELAKKLKALSERGEGGEKANAEEKLKAFMDKHGISIDDIEDNVIKERVFKLHKDQVKFFAQVVSSVKGRSYTLYESKSKARVKNYFTDLTDSEFVEIDMKFNFYWPIYEKERDLFYSAFIQKNHLYRKKEDDDKNDENLTEEEIERLKALVKMMNGMSSHTLRKQIDN